MRKHTLRILENKGIQVFQLPGNSAFVFYTNRYHTSQHANIIHVI